MKTIHILLLIILFPFCLHAQLKPENRKKVQQIISTFGGSKVTTEVSGEVIDAAANRIHCDVIINQGNQKDSVHFEGISNNVNGTIEIIESHVRQGKTFDKYSYTIDTAGIIISAFHEKEGTGMKRTEVFEIKKGSFDSALRSIYLPKAEYAIESFYKKFSKVF